MVAEIAHAKSAKVGKEFQMHGRRVGGERMIFNFAPHSRDTLTRGCLIFPRGCGPDAGRGRDADARIFDCWKLGEIVTKRGRSM